MRAREARLVNALRQNCRRPLTEIAEEINMPVSSVFKAVERLCKERIVTKHVCLLDFAKLDILYKAGVFIEANRKNGLKDLLAECPNINTLLRLSGDYDFYVELLFRDMTGLDDFTDWLRELEIVNKVSVHFLSHVKQEDFKVGVN